MSNLIRITVSPHVAIYLEHHYGTRIYLSDKNLITSTLKNLLQPYDKLDPFRLKGQRKESLGAFVDVFISDGLLRKYGGHMSNEAITEFDDSIDLMIKQEMYRWCNHPNAYFKEVDYNIKRFIDFYGFAEDDLTFDNLKRWYYRERQRIAGRKEKAPKEPSLTIPLLMTYLPEIPCKESQLAMF